MTSTPREKRFMGTKDPEEHIKISRKGGLVKGRKGLAALSPEKRLEIQRMGLKAQGKLKEDNDSKKDVVV